MKVNKTFLTIGIVATLLGACKKEEVVETVAPIVPQEVNQCVAQINTSAFTANGFGSTSGTSPNTFSVTFSNSTGGIYKQIILGSNYTFNIAPGTYSLNNNSTDTTSLFAYYALDTTYYSAISGTINIGDITIDPNATIMDGRVRTFVATFNFNTDTIAGNFYNVNGSGSYFNN